MSFETITLERRGRVGLVTLNRPKALNALCAQLVTELESALNELEADAGIGAILMRMTRAAVLRELESDAITFARARGLSEREVQGVALRGAAIPIVTGAGLILTFIIGGTIIVETVFALPGLGSLLQESVLFKDLPVVQAVTLLIAAAIAIITILVDLSYLLFDPRVRARELGQ